MSLGWWLLEKGLNRESPGLHIPSGLRWKGGRGVVGGGEDVVPRQEDSRTQGLPVSGVQLKVSF